MASSGTYSFQMSRDDLVQAALRKTTRFGSGDTIPPEDVTNVSQALNVMVKEMITDGMPLWCLQDIPIPLVANQPSYNLSTITGMTRPVQILDAYLRNAQGSDVGLDVESRWDYDGLGSKQSLGVANQLFYDPQLGAGTVTVYNVPQDNQYTLHVVIKRQIQDFNLSTDNPDFPQEAYRMLLWNLADEIALEYSTPRDVRQELTVKAKYYKEKFFSAEQEPVSVTFAPNQTRR